MTAALPPELWRLCFVFAHQRSVDDRRYSMTRVGKHDRGTLRAFALVCSAWAPVARSLLLERSVRLSSVKDIDSLRRRIETGEVDARTIRVITLASEVQAPDVSLVAPAVATMLESCPGWLR